MSVTSRQHALQFGPQRIHTPQARCGESACLTSLPIVTANPIRHPCGSAAPLPPALASALEWLCPRDARWMNESGGSFNIFQG